MNLFALTKTQEAGGQIALAAALAVAGFFLLLPRPRGRVVSLGIASLIAAAAVFGAWVYNTFGQPLPDVVGSVLFWMFSAGALVFGAVLVAQKNPARGAIAFAFVILSTCGLFLLLAAPFLMAATIIIYAGAIIVTFLFVLMLSQAAGPSAENDRSREPLYGSFAGFAFVGLVLFTLYQTSLASAPAEPGEVATAGRLPAPVLTAEERKKLADAVAKLDGAAAQLDEFPASRAERNKRIEYFEAIKSEIVSVVGPPAREQAGQIGYGTLPERLEKPAAKAGQPAELYREDAQARAALDRAASVRNANFTTAELEKALNPDDPPKPAPPAKPNPDAVKEQARVLRNEVVLLYGMGELPANNVRNLGLVLYSEHLLAIELAGTLLLVAVIGAIAIAHRKREVPGEPSAGSQVQRGVAK
ncbi:MAG: NADH-quinone oxidoreductase subunit J [Planctomycetes bacterium]|nr:NADH-quinone oxidoreductase subunit J [Planctomycetota bacterium]